MRPLSAGGTCRKLQRMKRLRDSFAEEITQQNPKSTIKPSTYGLTFEQTIKIFNNSARIKQENESSISYVLKLLTEMKTNIDRNKDLLSD